MASGDADGAVVTAVAYPLVAIAPAVTKLAVGSHQTLTARLTDVQGHKWTGCCVTWSSSDPSVLRVTTTNWNDHNGTKTPSSSTGTGGGNNGSSGTGQPSSGQGAPWATASVGDVLSWHWPTATFGPLTDATFRGPGAIVANPLGPGYCWRRDIEAATSDASYELNAEFESAPRHSAWVRFWYYQPPGDPQNSGTMKLVRFRESGFGHEYGTFDIQWNSYVFEGLNNLNTLANLGSIPSPNDNRGAWHEFLLHYDISTPGTQLLQIWIDKVKYFDTTISGALPSADGFGIIMIGGDVNADAATPAPASTDYIGAIDVFSSQPSDL